jgi:hypothetical protein
MPFATLCLGPDSSEHELVDLVGSHAYQRDAIDLHLGQATSRKPTAFIRRESLDLVRGLRLIGVDRREPPELPSACNARWEAVIPEPSASSPARNLCTKWRASRSVLRWILIVCRSRRRAFSSPGGCAR